MLVVFLIRILLALSLITPTLQFEWNILGTDCEDFPGKVENCWVEKYEVPDCNDEDSLLECAEAAENDARHCREEIKKILKNKRKLIKTLRDAVCEDRDLNIEFSKKPSCWHTARTCASSLLNLPDDKDVDEDACSQLLKSMERCNLLSAPGKCQEMQQNLTVEVFEASACNTHAAKLLGLNTANEVTYSIIAIIVTIVLPVVAIW